MNIPRASATRLRRQGGVDSEADVENKGSRVNLLALDGRAEYDSSPIVLNFLKVVIFTT